MTVAALKRTEASAGAPNVVLSRAGRSDGAAPVLTLLPGGKDTGLTLRAALPEIPPVAAPPALPLPAPVAAAWPRAAAALLFALSMHASALALLYMASVWGGAPDQTAEAPIEIEFRVEPPAAITPDVPLVPELPPPLPDPVIEAETRAPEAVQQETARVEQSAPESGAVQPAEIDIALPPPLPPPVFNIAPAEGSPAALIPAAAPRRPPPVRQIERERQLQRELARREEISRQAEIARRQELGRQKQAAGRRRERQAVAEAPARARPAARAPVRPLAQRPQAQTQRTAPVAPVSAAMSVSAFRAAVAAKIARNKPAASTADAVQGLVVIGFSITTSGAATGIRVTRSSGAGTLDAAALSAVRRASPFPPPPGAPRSFAIPMQFNRR